MHAQMDTYTNMYPHKSCTHDHTHNSECISVLRLYRCCYWYTWQAQYQFSRLQRPVCIMLSSAIHLAGNKIWYFYVEVLRNKIIHGTARHTHLCSSVNFQNSQRQCTKHALELKQLGLYNSCYSIKELGVM